MDNTTLNAGDSEELAEQIYDLLMAEIEPDLMLANLPLLDEKYAGESEQDQKKRMARYERSYAEFDRQFNDFMNEVNDDVRDSKRASLAKQESDAKKSEQDELASLEAAFS